MIVIAESPTAISAISAITVIPESPKAISGISADRRFLQLSRASARTPLARKVADIFCRDFVAPKNSAMTVIVSHPPKAEGRGIKGAKKNEKIGGGYGIIRKSFFPKRETL